MVNKSKQKGTRWENDLVDLLNENLVMAKAKRIPGSGALGTIIEEPILQGDIRVIVEGLPRDFRMEAKVGYGGKKQLTVQREWFNKIKREADNSYSLPAVACKFLGARKVDGIQHFIALDLDTFCFLLNHISILYNELED